MKNLLITILTITTLVMSVLVAADIAKSSTERTPFDHSQCQYPERATNPVDGCDNSDPANPECIKGGLEVCDVVETPVLVKEEKIQAVQTCQN